jgi:hypothetical protein
MKGEKYMEIAFRKQGESKLTIEAGGGGRLTAMATPFFPSPGTADCLERRGDWVPLILNPPHPLSGAQKKWNEANSTPKSRETNPIPDPALHETKPIEP